MDFIQLGALRSLREELNDLFVNSGFEIEPLNKLIYRDNNNDSKLVSKNFIEIVFVIDIRENQYIVFYKISTFPEQVLFIHKVKVRRQKNGRCYFEVDQIIKVLQNCRIKIKEIELFKEACRIYISSYLQKLLSRKKKKIPIILTGWQGNKKNILHFIGITKQNKVVNFFNDLDDIKENIKNIELDNFLSDNNYILIVAYLFYSILKRLLKEKCIIYDQELPMLKEDFSFCLYGKHDVLTIQAVANIFFNFFDVNVKKIHTIVHGEQIYLDSFFLDLTEKNIFADIPQIIENNNNIFKKTDKILKEILTGVRNSKMIYSPIFLSQIKMDWEYIFSFDIGQLNWTKNDLEEESIKQKRATIYLCILNFIQEISDYLQIKGYKHKISARISQKDEETNTIKAQHMKNFLKEYVTFQSELEQNPIYDGNKIEMIIQLYFCYNFFIELFWNNYLKGHEKDIIDIKQQLRNNSKNFFLQSCICSSILRAEEKQEVQEQYQEKDVAEIWEEFKKYINAIFLEKSISPNFIYWEGKERNNNYKCYYFSYHDVLEDFEKFSHIDLQYRKEELFSFLKQENIILTKKHANGKEKIYQNKKIYVLAVRKDKVN